MTKKRKDTEAHGGDLLENPEALAEQFSRTEQFVEKNKSLVMIIGGVVVAVLAGVLFMQYMNKVETKGYMNMLWMPVPHLNLIRKIS